MSERRCWGLFDKATGDLAGVAYVGGDLAATPLAGYDVREIPPEQAAAFAERLARPAPRPGASR